MCDVVIKMYVYQNSHISAYYQGLYHLLKVKIVAYDMVLWHKLKGLAHAKIIENRWFYFGFLIWPYDVNMSID